MNYLAILAGVFSVLGVLWDAFETIVLPRQVTRRFRLARAFYRVTWVPWSWAARFAPTRKLRERFLGIYGPLSLPFLLGVWAVGMIFGFGLLFWSLGDAVPSAAQSTHLFTAMYLSGSTFFTLGLGDVVPHTTLARSLAVAEAGTGFGFLALVLGYLPVIYQSFSRREVVISLLDARAGSPPSAAELLRRMTGGGSLEDLEEFLHEWEHWAADLLESHLSYPVLIYFRSQHDNQSWISALCAVLDASAFLTSALEGSCLRQARLTFAMARHATVDLARVFRRVPAPLHDKRVLPEAIRELCRDLAAAGVPLRPVEDLSPRFLEFRQMYEPYLRAMADFLQLDLPGFAPASRRPDNWQTSIWNRLTSGAPPNLSPPEHF
jgi:hypothetical protein